MLWWVKGYSASGTRIIAKFGFQIDNHDVKDTILKSATEKFVTTESVKRYSLITYSSNAKTIFEYTMP